MTGTFFGRPYRPALDAALFAETIKLPFANLTFAQAHRMLRDARVMTQKEISSLSGISQPTLSDLDTGRMDPRLSLIRKVWHALDCEPVLLPRPLNEWAWRDPQWRRVEVEPFPD